MSRSMAPMKLHHAELTDVDAYLEDDDWVLEQKHDGTRAMAIIQPAAPEPVRWLTSGGGPLRFAAAAQWLPVLSSFLVAWAVGRGYARVVLDGELMIATGQYRVFDLPHLEPTGEEPVVTQRSTYRARRRALHEIGRTWSPHGLVQPVPSVDNAVGKRLFWLALSTSGVEGGVVKHLDGEYEPGVRTLMQRKLKFVRTADVVVMAIKDRSATTGSAVLGVAVDGSALTNLKQVGNASLIGKDRRIEVGSVVEVGYLYWTGTAMVQPRIRGLRQDKPQADCALDQFETYSRTEVTP